MPRELGLTLNNIKYEVASHSKCKTQTIFVLLLCSLDMHDPRARSIFDDDRVRLVRLMYDQHTLMTYHYPYPDIYMPIFDHACPTNPFQ